MMKSVLYLIDRTEVFVLLTLTLEGLLKDYRKHCEEGIPSPSR